MQESEYYLINGGFVILEYWPSSKLRPMGGPPGYLYNLREALTGRDDLFCFYEGDDSKKRAFAKKGLEAIKKLRLAKMYSVQHLSSRRPSVNFSDYKAVHFHSTQDLFLERDSLNSYRGKVILTSHTPCAPHIEKIAAVSEMGKRLFPINKQSLAFVDEYAFRRADRIVFPCRESEEPYFHTWEDYVNIRDQSKMTYIPTGIKERKPKMKRQQMREAYSIPDDAIVFSFVGRHTEVKGYGDLVAFAGAYLQNHPNVFFLIAGNEGPLPKLKHNRWIEVGWTDDPYSVIAASDAFILPNRETYFDLALLEALSVGVPVFARLTGGNKFFLKHHNTGILFFAQMRELNNMLNDFTHLDNLAHNELGEMNRELFSSHYSLNHFRDRYIDFAYAICD